MVPNPTTQHVAPWEVADGRTVYAIDGEKLGTVRNCDLRAGYFDVQRGWIFHRDFYVALSDVTMIDANGIVLRLTKDQLDDDRYTSPPTGAVAYGEGFDLTEKKPTDVPNDDVTAPARPKGGIVY